MPIGATTRRCVYVELRLVNDGPAHAVNALEHDRNARRLGRGPEALRPETEGNVTGTVDSPAPDQNPALLMFPWAPTELGLIS